MYVDSFSLLWPGNEEDYKSRTKTLLSATVDNLNLDGLCKSIAGNTDNAAGIRDILCQTCCDEEVINYRQEIFNDIALSYELMNSVEKILDQLQHLKYLQNESLVPEEINLWKFFARFKELDGYIDCVTIIAGALRGLELKSTGMKHLRDTSIKISEDEEFRNLSRIVKNLGVEINEIQSITLGINLDSSLDPVEAMLVSVNKTRFKDNSWFMDFIPMPRGVKLEDYGLVSKIHKLSADKRHSSMYVLTKDIESFIKPVARDLHTLAKKSNRIRANFLVELIPELTFYYKFARMFKRLKDNGMPVCRPEIVKISERRCIIKGAFNINLALHMLAHGDNPSQEIVLNNINFDDNGRVFILTGPNRGGKTVYTEAIGLAQVLFQAGVFVPGEMASISPVDAIFSHFPVDENQTVELGRLGEETKRLSEIFEEATKHSLILLNESLASTSFIEGLYIAQDVVKSLKYLEARALFNTHMHELASYAETINSEVSGNSEVVSLVTGLVEGKRSYKIQPGSPLGKSYARDIAEKYDMSFEQIISKINMRKYCSNTVNVGET